MAQPEISTRTFLQMILRAVLAPIVVVLLLFLLAGRWDYWQAWVLVALILLSELLMGTILTRNKGLIEERLNPKEGVKSWDKVYFGITTPLYFMAIILGGLDARFGWTRDMPLAVYWTVCCLRPRTGDIPMGALHQQFFLEHGPHPGGSGSYRLQRRSLSLCAPSRLRRRLPVHDHRRLGFGFLVGNGSTGHCRTAADLADVPGR